MGSGTERRKTDRPIIRRPRSGGGSGGVGSGESGLGEDKAETIARACLPSFDVEIQQVPQLKAGARVELNKKGRVYAVTFFGQEIAELSKQRSNMIEKCLELSVGYKGEIMERKKRTVENQYYARFFRSL